MTQSKKLRIGLIGAGTHGRHAVIPSVANTGRCTLVAVADQSLQNLESISEWEGPKFSSLGQMLDETTLDALYIATLPDSHCALALAALERGLHVICEKPIAANSEEAQWMVEAAQRAGRHLIVMFENRVHPAYRKIKEWIDSRALGRIEAIHLQSFGKHPVEQPRRTALLNAAGCLDCGIHMLDLIRLWTGGDKWNTIHALGTWFGEPVENPPHIGILARLDNNVLVTFENSFSFGYRVKTAPRDFGKRSLTIVGTEGVIIDKPTPDGLLYQLITDDLREEILFQDLHHSDEIAKVLDHLAAVALDGESPLGGYLAFGIDGLRAQTIVDEVNRQSREAKCPEIALAHHEPGEHHSHRL